MNNYDDLYRNYSQLLIENQKLKSENDRLRRQLAEGNKQSDSSSLANARINKFSSSDEKIALFRSLFCGREDVFARRWYSTTTGKSGYQPVCGNEWVQELCDKRKYKCSICSNRKLVPLTDQDIFKHLSGKDVYGRDVIGIYPMLRDETCRFLCVDFDEEGYQEDVTRTESDRAAGEALIATMKSGIELYREVQNNPSFKKWLFDSVFNATYVADSGNRV